VDQQSNTPALFQEEALTANRRGTITDVQLKVIQWPIRLHIILQWISLLAIIAGGAYGLTFLSLEPDIWMILLSVALVMIFLMAWLTHSRVSSLNQREVASVAGQISRRTISAGKKVKYEIQVGRKKFRVPESIYNSMSDEAYYRIYYQPKINVLLTAEQV
jgi:uncharacterized membrane protein